MAHLQLVKQTSSGLLLPATPESGDFLRSVKIGEWIHADFKRVRNYAFHKRFFKLLQLGFDYWTPTGGTVTSREQKLISGFVNFLCDSAGQEYTPALNEAAEQYLHNVATLRTGDVALLKSFDAFREWVTVQAGFYTDLQRRLTGASKGDVQCPPRPKPPAPAAWAMLPPSNSLQVLDKTFSISAPGSSATRKN